MSQLLYRLARLSRDAKAVENAIKQRSVKPLVKRAWNKWIGRNVVSKVWWR